MEKTIPTKSSSKIELPALGLGTWLMGGLDGRDPKNNDQADIAAIRWAISHGMTHIDTAETYGNGYTEALVGQALQGVDRNSVFVASKVLPQHLRYDDVIAACKASLERLQLTYLDLYLVHRPNPQTPMDETMRSFASLYESGLIRNIGLSNADVPVLEEAMSVSRYPIVNNQIHYSLAARLHEQNGVLDWCANHDVLVTAYRPLGVGKPKRGEVVSPLLDELAVKYHATRNQIAIAWVLARPNVVALVKSSNIAHLEENLGAVNIALSPEDYERLRVEVAVGETIWGPVLS